VFAACGANGPAPKTIQPAASADGGATTVALTVSSALPEAKLPPPLRLNSKRVARKPMPAWAGCAAASKPVGDAAKSLDALTNVCAAGSKVRPGSPISGSGNATTPAASSRFHAEAGRCYRVYGAASAGVKGFIVTIMDADGANVAEYHADSVSPFIAPDEALCAEKAEDLTVLVAVGAGDGGYAVSIGAEP
jgi:hypothetical protein